MRFVVLHMENSREPVYLNPDHVTAIVPSGQHKCNVYSSHGDAPLLISGTAEQIARIIQRDKPVFEQTLENQYDCAFKLTQQMTAEEKTAAKKLLENMFDILKANGLIPSAKFDKTALEELVEKRG